LVVKCLEDAGVNAVEPIGLDVEAVGILDDKVVGFFFFSCFSNDFSNCAETSVCFVSGVPDNEEEVIGAVDVVDEIVISVGIVVVDSVGIVVVDTVGIVVVDSVVMVVGVVVVSVVVDVGGIEVVDSVVDVGGDVVSIVVVAGGVPNVDGEASGGTCDSNLGDDGGDSSGADGSGSGSASGFDDDIDGSGDDIFSLRTSDVFGIIGPGTGPDGLGGLGEGEVLGIMGMFPVIIKVINLFKDFLLFAK
jgi:hypothetical protein